MPVNTRGSPGRARRPARAKKSSKPKSKSKPKKSKSSKPAEVLVEVRTSSLPFQ
jgi:hypothetical protein